MFKQSTNTCDLIILNPNANILTRIKITLNEYFIKSGEFTNGVYAKDEITPTSVLSLDFSSLLIEDRKSLFSALSNLRTSSTIFAVTEQD